MQHPYEKGERVVEEDEREGKEGRRTWERERVEREGVRKVVQEMGEKK